MKLRGNFSSSRRKAAVALTLAIAAVASGCAGFLSAPPEQQVLRRADQYWQARVKGDLKTAYELSTPSYRKVRSLEQFQGKFGSGARFVNAEVSDVRCTSERCTVSMKLGIVPSLPGIRMGTIPSSIEEVWVLESGQWWHFQDL